MQTVKTLVKQAFSSLGLTVSKRDRLAEQIPAGYLQSPYLPPIYRQSFSRLLYFQHIFEQIRVSGDIVECVSIGTGILNWALLCDLGGDNRRIVGFDSFSGFPASQEADRKADGLFETQAGDYASPPELVLKILGEGRVSSRFVQDNVRLVRGYFDATLPRYDGEIALLHLDCDLYESYAVCLKELYPKVVPGGIIMFDEYEDETFPGAKRAIDEFFADQLEKPIAYRKYDYLKYYVIKRGASLTTAEE
jgi:hypothetical protein